MEKNKVKRRLFDMDDSYIPPHQRVFQLKVSPQKSEPEKRNIDDVQSRVRVLDVKSVPAEEYGERMNVKSMPIPSKGLGKGEAPSASETSGTDTDESGLDKAYADSSNLHLDSNGTLYVAGTKGNFWGSEWLENYVTMGVPLVANAIGIQAPYAIEENERYKQLDNFMKMHPGQVKNLVGHSKGSAVIHTWMKNNPEFKGQSRLYATPYEDVFGKEKAKESMDQISDMFKGSVVSSAVKEVENIFGLDKVNPVKGETRIANNFDPAAILDGSANRYDHPNPFKYISSGGPHDYHEGIARLTSGFGLSNAITDKPGTDFDKNYRNPFNLPSNYTWQATPATTPASSQWTNPDGSTSITQ